MASRAIEQVKGPDLTPASTFPSGRSLGRVRRRRRRDPRQRDDGRGRTIIPGAITDGTSAADHGSVRVFHGTPTPVIEEQWEALGDLEGLRGQASAEASARQADCDALETSRETWMRNDLGYVPNANNSRPRTKF